MHVGPAFIAHREPTVARQPGERPLDHPAMPPQPGTGVDPASRDARADVASPQFRAAVPVIVGLVGVQLRRAPTATTPWRPERWDRIKECGQERVVVGVRPTQQACQRNPLRIGDQVTFGARFAAIRGVGADRLAPLFAGAFALSRQARSHAMRPACPS